MKIYTYLRLLYGKVLNKFNMNIFSSCFTTLIKDEETRTVVPSFINQREQLLSVS